MELLAALFIWPFLLLAIFLVGLSFAVINGTFVVILIIFFIILIALLHKELPEGSSPVRHTSAEELAQLREIAIVFCISLFLPLFSRYLISATNESLIAVIVALALGFSILLWGLFIKGNRMLLYSNLIGGGLTILYSYFEIWSLGPLARVIATAFGLVVAVVFSIIKLKEKLK